MRELFLRFLDAGLSGSVIIATVLLLRLVLKKAPRAAVCLLWGLVMVRLLCPFSIPSPFSLQPDLHYNPAQPEAVISQHAPVSDNVDSPSTALDPGVFPTPQVRPDGSQTPLDTPQVSEPDPASPSPVAIAGIVWLCGTAVLLLYAAVSFLGLKWKVRGAIPMDSYFETHNMDTAFVLGLLTPKIYLPAGLSRDCRNHVLEHERAHIARKDHWFKLLGFIALAVHWYNPLVWISFWLLCRDIEMACDQRVVEGKSLEFRKSYSAALLQCSAGHHTVHACPVAFAETGVKQRIVGVLNYRKPAFWLTVAAIVIIICVVLFLMTDPITDRGLNWAQNLTAQDIQSAELFVSYAGEEECYHSYTEDEFEALAAYIRSVEGRWQMIVPQTEGGFSAITITTTDGETHSISLGSTLTIDGITYKPDSAWAKEFPTKGTDPYPIGQEHTGSMGSEDKAGWGLTVTAADVTPTGCTFVFTQKGGAVEDAELFTGSEFWIQVYKEPGWYSLEVIPEELVWTAIAHIIPQNGSIDFELNWKQIYGVLPAGRYRVGKTVYGPTAHGGETSHSYYAEFEITDGTYAEAALLESCRLALEEFQSRGSWYLMVNDSFVHDSSATKEEWWISGNDWIHSSTPAGAVMYKHTMCRDGNFYQKLGGGGYIPPDVEPDVWYPTGILYGTSFPWLLTVSWDSARITLESHQSAMGSQEVVLRCEGPLQLFHHWHWSADSAELTLTLGSDGKLASATITASVTDENGNGAIFYGSVTDLGSDPDAIANHIESQTTEE